MQKLFGTQREWKVTHQLIFFLLFLGLRSVYFCLLILCCIFSNVTLKHHICDLDGVLIDTNSNGEQVVVNLERFYFGCQLLDYLNF